MIDTTGSTPLLCPHCHSAEIRSVEKALIGYPARLFRGPDGGVDVEYTGGEYTTYDEGTVYDGEELWCRDCAANFTEADLVVAHEVDA